VGVLCDRKKCTTNWYQILTQSYVYVHTVHTDFLLFVILLTYAQISGVKINIKITATCFAVNTPSSGGLQLC
jgi:hypothetical protein